MVKDHNKEEWITVREAMKLTGKSYATIQNIWKNKGVFEWKQLQQGVKRSPIYINKLSIPTFLRLKSNII